MNNLLDKSEICSMANRRKWDTGLPVNIWIDEEKWYLIGGHGKRIKFQLNHANMVYNQPSAVMDLNGNVVVEVWNKVKNDSEISLREINEVSNFVKNNSYAFDKVADEMIYMNQFDLIMIKGGKQASESAVDELKRKVDEFILKNNERENNVIIIKDDIE